MAYDGAAAMECNNGGRGKRRRSWRMRHFSSSPFPPPLMVHDRAAAMVCLKSGRGNREWKMRGREGRSECGTETFCTWVEGLSSYERADDHMRI
jgi:hypothetical protein